MDCKKIAGIAGAAAFVGTGFASGQILIDYAEAEIGIEGQPDGPGRIQNYDDRELNPGEVSLSVSDSAPGYSGDISAAASFVSVISDSSIDFTGSAESRAGTDGMGGGNAFGEINSFAIFEIEEATSVSLIGRAALAVIDSDPYSDGSVGVVLRNEDQQVVRRFDVSGYPADSVGFDERFELLAGMYTLSAYAEITTSVNGAGDEYAGGRASFEVSFVVPATGTASVLGIGLVSGRRRR